MPHILKLNRDYLLTINGKSVTELEYIATFVKGKKPKIPNDYRFIMRIPSGHLVVLWLDRNEDNLPYGTSIQILDDSMFKQITSNHFKNGCYNYYCHNIDYKEIDNMLQRWVKLDPYIHIGNYIHRQMSKIDNYKSMYTFDGKDY